MSCQSSRPQTLGKQKTLKAKKKKEIVKVTTLTLKPKVKKPKVAIEQRCFDLSFTFNLNLLLNIVVLGYNFERELKVFRELKPQKVN